MKNKVKTSTWVALPIVLSLCASCATIPKFQPPQPEELRVDLGRIGVVSASFQPEVNFQRPMTKGKAAAAAAAEGAAAVLMSGQHCYGMDCAAVLALAPVGAVVGSILGAVRGVSSQKIKETEEILNGYLATVNFQETICERFLSVAREQTKNPILPLEVQGPSTLDEQVTYGPLSDEGIDTILEIGLRECQLWGGRDGINPPLHLLMTVGIRLIRTTDGLVLISRSFVYDYQNVPLKFSEWGADNALPFRKELDRDFQHLAMEIIRLLLNIQIPLNPESSHVTEFE